MTSVFDDPRPTLTPPTEEDLFRRAGEPLLEFDLADGSVPIPPGLLSCCRVMHQPHCDHHVALSLVACHFEVRYPDGSVDERHPVHRSFEGDVLRRPEDLAATVQAVGLQAAATAAASGAVLVSLRFAVWGLSLELAELWRHLERERDLAYKDVLIGADGLEAAALEMLPIELVETEEGLGAVALLQARPDWKPVQGYADRVMVLPHEIGRTDDARYVTSLVWGDGDGFLPAAASILRDPAEKEAP